MNKLSLLALAIISIGIAPLSHAELVIYKGTEKELNTLGNNGQPVTWKVFVIVDLDTGLYDRIRYATIQGTKLYRTLVQTNTHIVHLVSADARNYTAITHIPSDCQAQQSPGSESVSFRGLDAPLKINDNSTVMFPRSFTDEGVGLYHDSTNNAYLDGASFILVFNSAQTLASNRAAETLDAAFNRLVAYVQSLGY